MHASFGPALLAGLATVCRPRASFRLAQVHPSPGFSPTVLPCSGVRLFAPPTAGPQLYPSLVAVGPVFLPVTLPLPPSQGRQGISPIWGRVSGLDAHDHRNSEAVIRFHVPNLAALQGLSIAPQSATIELVSGGLWLCAAEPPARNYSAF